MAWNGHELLIPDEPPEVDVSVSVGGARATAGAKPAGGNGKGGGGSGAYASGPYTQASPFSSGPGVGGGYQQAYAAHSQQQAAAAQMAARAAAAAQARQGGPQGPAQGQSWGHTTFPAWKPLAERMLKDHPNLLKGSKENQFLADQSPAPCNTARRCGSPRSRRRGCATSWGGLG